MPDNRSGHVLLVEDNPDDLDLTLHAFAKSGLINTMQVVRDGAEATIFSARASSSAGTSWTFPS